uniref:Cathepsin propeptide inhibitor domain-containing protein n=1 Tax=Ananas comosus var. bracteatus TaxID=296719 RepID=A0A6V7QWB3_ANACO
MPVIVCFTFAPVRISFTGDGSSCPRHSDPARDHKRGNMATTTVKNSSSRLSDEAMRRIHQNWMRRYDRKYADEDEEEKRSKIFKATFEEIEEYNTGEETCLVLLSRYSDLTDEEFFALSPNLKDDPPEDMQDDITIRELKREEHCDACCRYLCCK